MQCRSCGAQLPTGAANCPNCGANASYNAQSSGGYDPTVMAPSQPPVPPTSYGSPPPPPSTPGVGSSNPYGSSSSSSSSPYNASTYGSGYPSNQPQQPQYQPPAQQPQYQQPGGYQYGAPPQVPGYPQMPQGPQKNNNMAIIIGAVAAVVVIGSLIAVFAFLKPGGNTPVTNKNTPTTEATATTEPTEKPTEKPSATASKIIVNAQMASEIHPDDYTPTKVTTTFQEGDTVYVTFEIDLTGITPKDGYYGNVKAEFYVGNKLDAKGTLDELDEAGTDPSEGNIPAYFSLDNYAATESGKVKLYWCETQSCSNPELAQTVTFTVK